MVAARIVDLLARRSRLLCAVGASLVALSAGAQVPATSRPAAPRDTTPRVPRPTVPLPTDTAATPVPSAPGQPPRITVDTTPRPPRRPRAAQPLVQPPISPRRALIYSLLIPGLGQSKLDRGATGAFFVAIETGALTMVAKSAFDLAEAKAFRGDSLLATSFPVDTAGKPTTATVSVGSGTAVPNTFSAALVRARRLHLEDWLAVIAFNHLISGAEAFVSANLWDVPGEVSVTPTRRGTAISLSFRW